MARRVMSGLLVCLVLVLHVSLLGLVHRLLCENAELRAMVGKSSCPGKDGKKEGHGAKRSFLDKEGNVPTPITRKPREFDPSKLTFVLFNPHGDNSASFLEIDKRLEKIKQNFQSVTVLRSSGQNVGESLNEAVSHITTEYFLILEAHASLSPRDEESITFLWDALETYPEIDFVGGSYLTKDNKLHLSCRRFRLCRWTYSESYEYARSLDNVMICDGTSSSFMGRTWSFNNKTTGFDATLPGRWVVKDFFLRAKSSNIVVGTRPNVMFLVNQFETLYEAWNLRDITAELVPFSVKHKVFIYKDIDGNTIELCSPTSPLSGKDLCIEKTSHNLMLANRHWAYNGLYTYPYLLRYLEFTLSVVTEFLDRHNVTYVIKGGISLGAIKMRSILPWEAGDIDVIVYDTDLEKLYTTLKPLADEEGYVVRKHPAGNAVHVYCTPKEVGDYSGGLATLFHHREKGPEQSDIVKIQTSGTWASYRRNIVHGLLGSYGKGYLEHRLYRRREHINCKIEGHNACLPDFETMLRGRGGNLREYYCEV